ncbi:tRNA lysidine(34) synthetase TilS [Novosphingobium sp. PC22D]|uniref:tRNA lysidine(34) synthetase TilS n=1 Tax=Novosphingobium sp. PC22D TaxID=1962403 RepID=UPI000BEF952F|nr:tRNA lysidine(34) synthetase TilS [Novosphingobium sp. PC22D]PEQ12772.1 tRNA lysidine(34) synthetase TilS [Novosphingobium sp. PC22D]
MGSTAAADRAACDPLAVTRFAGRLAALWPEGADEAAKLGLAVSGGPDSTAMLLLAAAALPGRVEAVTVDHGLRAEAATEAAMVASLCAEIAVPHRTIAVEVASGNLQAEARRARYAAMLEWIEARGLGALATAHHADDQAETLLMRLNRASGVAGLAGARARGIVPGSRLPLLRPVLDWRRSELEGVVARAGAPFVQDPSNLDDRFDRVRMRKALAAADWLDVPAIAASAGFLSEADEVIEWAAQLEYRQSVRTEALGVSYRPRAPKAVVLRVVARIVRDLDGNAPRGSAVARLVESLVEGRPASIGGLIVRSDASGWSFMPAPKRRAAKSVASKKL